MSNAVDQEMSNSGYEYEIRHSDVPGNEDLYVVYITTPRNGRQRLGFQVFYTKWGARRVAKRVLRASRRRHGDWNLVEKGSV